MSLKVAVPESRNDESLGSSELVASQFQSVQHCEVESGEGGKRTDLVVG